MLELVVVWYKALINLDIESSRTSSGLMFGFQAIMLSLNGRQMMSLKMCIQRLDQQRRGVAEAHRQSYLTLSTSYHLSSFLFRRCMLGSQVANIYDFSS
jgi:hypothetical protein